MKFIDLLEAPLKGIDYYRPGGTKNTGSFSDKDRAVINKFMKDKTYKTKLQKFPGNLYVYIIDDAILNNYGKSFPEGEIQMYDLENFKYKQEDSTGESGVQIYLEYPAVVEKIKSRLKKEKYSIHLIMGDNHSDTNQVPPTPWILAHRLLHAVFKNSKQFQDAVKLGNIITRTLYSALEKDKKKLIKCFTFASARHNIISLSEAPLEMATQLVVTGSFKLNLEDVPKESHNEINELVQEFEDTVYTSIDNCGGLVFYI